MKKKYIDYFYLLFTFSNTALLLKLLLLFIYRKTAFIQLNEILVFPYNVELDCKFSLIEGREIFKAKKL